MSVRELTALTLAVVAMAGCSGTGDATSETRTSGPTAVEPTLAVPPDEAKAVIQDWYFDGIFNSPHRCEAVRAAIARLPTAPREYTTVYDDMQSLERRICA